MTNVRHSPPAPALLLDNATIPNRPTAAPKTARPGRLITCAAAARQTRPRRQHHHAAQTRTLICAVDGVILLRDPTLTTRIEHRHGLPPGALADMATWPSTMLTTIGALDHHTWLRYAHASLPAEAVGEYLADHGTPNTLAVEILRAATTAGDLRLLLTANSTITLHDDLAHHHLNDLAHQVYLSVHTGHATPDPRALDHILRAEALHPTQAVYIDSDRRNTETAHQLGLRTHCYTTPESLRHFLTTSPSRSRAR